MLKLYQFANCHFCEKVRQKLAELNLPYEKIEVSFSRSEKPAVVLQKNHGRVPVLDDDGQIIVESDDIVDYLEVKYGQNPPT